MEKTPVMAKGPVMEKRSSQLRSSGWCRIRREHNINTEDVKGTAYQYAAAVKGIDLDILFGKTPEADLWKRLDEDFAGIDYPIDAVREVKKAEAGHLIERHIRGEDRKPYRLKARTITVSTPSGDIKVTGAPDIVLFGEETVELVILRVGKPNVTQTGSKKDGSVNTSLELYFMYKFGQQLVPRGKKWKVTASYYFLRRADDDPKSGTFEPDFFGDGYTCPKKGKNIVSLSGEVWKHMDGTIEPTKIDELFLPQFEEFYNGRDCGEEECRTCDFYRLCSYKLAPKYVTKESKQHPFSSIMLSKAQEDIAAFRKGTAVVNAGAGAGKTMIICYRIVNLLGEGCRPEDIILVTFTNSAAEEMRDRIQLYCDDVFGEGLIDMGRMTVTTFNSFCYEIVKKEYARFGFSEQPGVIDDVERAAIISRVLQDHRVAGLDYRNFDTDMPSCRGALSVCSKAFEVIKTHRLSVGDEEELAGLMKGYVPFTGGTPTMSDLLSVYCTYDDILKKENLVEFADQELLVFDLLEDDPYYLERFGFRHIVVDEFQDTSKTQLELVKQLKDNPEFESLLVVGDDSQAVYGFRDTTPEYMINFEKYIGCQVTKFDLVENYRSSDEIIELANKINALNVNRVMKDLRAVRGPVRKPEVKGFFSKDDEYSWIAAKVKELTESGKKPEDIAFIAADKYQLLEMGDALTKRGVPWVTLNPEPYLDNSKVEAAVALAKTIGEPSDTKDLMVWLNAKSGNTLLDEDDSVIEKMMEEERAALTALGTSSMTDDELQKKFHEMAESINTDDDELYSDFLAKAGRKPGFRRELGYIMDFEKYGAKVTYKRNRSYPGVVLVTAHSGKGLEWDTVFVSLSKFDSQALRKSGDAAIEEKRRLVFVSFTRARDRLFVTSQYAAFGPRDKRTYNMFFKETVMALGEKYDPVDHEGEEKRAKAEKEKKEKAKAKRIAKKAAEAADEALLPPEPAAPAPSGK